MFKWIDYEKKSILFIDGISTDIAILRHRDFQLHKDYHLHDNMYGKHPV